MTQLFVKLSFPDCETGYDWYKQCSLIISSKNMMKHVAVLTLLGYVFRALRYIAIHAVRHTSAKLMKLRITR